MWKSLSFTFVALMLVAVNSAPQGPPAQEKPEPVMDFIVKNYVLLF